MAVLVAVHVFSALAVWNAGDSGLVEGLFLGRGTWFRIEVGGQYRPLVADGETWRLYTSVLLHGDALHLLINAIALVALGRLVEPWVGHVRFLAWFLAGGVAGSVASQAAQVSQSDGASGGAFALLAAAVVLGWRMRTGLSRDDRWLLGPVLGAFLVANVVLSFVLPFIDAAGHLGGLALGAVVALVAPVDPERRPPASGSRVLRAAEGAWVALYAVVCILGWI